MKEETEFRLVWRGCRAGIGVRSVNLCLSVMRRRSAAEFLWQRRPTDDVGWSRENTNGCVITEEGAGTFNLPNPAFLSNFPLPGRPSLPTNDQENEGRKQRVLLFPNWGNWLCTHWTGSVGRRGQSLCAPPAAASICLPPPPARRHTDNSGLQRRANRASQQGAMGKRLHFSAIHLEGLKRFIYLGSNKPLMKQRNGKRAWKSDKMRGHPGGGDRVATTPWRFSLTYVCYM